MGGELAEITLVIAHHHLNRGGVTSVIRNQLGALAAVDAPIARVLLVHGGRRDDWPEATDSSGRGLVVEHLVLPELDYDPAGASLDAVGHRATPLVGRLTSELRRRGIEVDGTVIHIHNHSLGKNLVWIEAIWQLAHSGWRCLLQVHDFAEDQRPGNYRRLAAAQATGDAVPLRQRLYPQAAHIHYAVLSGRDYRLLRQAGIASNRLWQLPNSCGETDLSADRAQARRKLSADLSPTRPLVLYPVRGIRRKQLGEFLLWAARWQRTHAFALTLAPENPDEQQVYRHWVELARRLQLPVFFDTGGAGGLRLADNLAASDILITTSVAEGFGMVFLESWLSGRPLIGRDLPEITADFRDAGLSLSDLSAERLVPIDWFDDRQLFAPLRKARRELCGAYGLAEATVRDHEWEAWEESVRARGAIDFARLSPKLQTATVERIASGGAADVDLLDELNPEWQSLEAANAQNRGAVIRRNAEVVRHAFGLPAIGRRLCEIYQRLRTSEPEPLKASSASEVLLKEFSHPRRLYPVRFMRPDE